MWEENDKPFSSTASLFLAEEHYCMKHITSPFVPAAEVSLPTDMHGVGSDAWDLLFKHSPQPTASTHSCRGTQQPFLAQGHAQEEQRGDAINSSAAFCQEFPVDL